MQNENILIKSPQSLSDESSILSVTPANFNSRLIMFAKNVFNNLAAVTAICTLIGAFFLHVYLGSVGLPSLFMNCVTSPASLLAVTFGFGLLFISVWGLLIFTPLCISWGLLALGQEKHVAQSPKWFWVAMLAITSPFSALWIWAMTFEQAKNFFDHIGLPKTGGFFLAFLVITLPFFIYHQYKGNKPKPSDQPKTELVQGLAIFLIIYSAQVINTLPLFLFVTLINSGIEDGSSQWIALGVMLAVYGTLAGLAVDQVIRANNSVEQVLKLKVGFGFGGAFLAFVCILLFPLVFIAGASRFVGVLEQKSVSEWYKIDKDALAAVEPRKSTWNDKYWQSGYLYGFMIFQIGDVKVLCQPETKLDASAKDKCFIFRASDLRPIGHPAIWPYSDAYEKPTTH